MYKRVHMQTNTVMGSKLLLVHLQVCTTEYTACKLGSLELWEVVVW